MDVDSLSLSKLLNLLIRKFITELENYLETINVDKNKVFQEILKRKKNVSQSIRLLALKTFANISAGESISDEDLDDKIKTIVESVLQQDMIECALISSLTPSKNLTYDEVYCSLFLCSTKDTNSLTASFEDLLSKMSVEDLKSCVSTLEIDSSSINMKNIDCISLSSQFNKSRAQFEEGLWQLQSILGTESTSEFKSSEAYSKLSHEVKECSKNTISSVFKEDDIFKQETELDWLLYSDIHSSSYDLLNFRTASCNTWEGRMKQLVPFHLYSSELTEEEAVFNVNDEDPQIFHSLYDSSLAISEDDIKRDILDLLVGIPSDTFIFNCNGRKLEFGPQVHLTKLSHESTSKFLDKFVKSGNTFIRLKMFSSELHVSQEGLVMHGFKKGIRQILTLYTEFIMSVKTQKPSLQYLKTDVMEASQFLNTLESICRINEDNDFPQLPKGLGLVSYLNENLWSQRRKEHSIMIGVILKYTYIPYFNFLNKWINEGVCYDPYHEFQILEDCEYLDRKDEMYWKQAHTEIISDRMRAVPPEIQNFSADIMQCGKNMRLLKICYPRIFSFEFMLHNKPPSFSMIFSYNAAVMKASNCASYIANMEEAELNQCAINEVNSVKNKEFFFIHSNMVSKNQTDQDCRFKNLMKMDSTTLKYSHVRRRCNSLEKSSSKLNFQNNIVMKDVGILFSHCDCTTLKNSISPNADKESVINELKHLFDSKQNGNAFTLPRQKYLASNNESPSCDKVNYNGNLSDFNKLPTADFNSTKKSPIHSLTHVHSKTINKIGILAQFSEESELAESSEALLEGTFANSLASLLLSNYDETVHDINSCLQLISLQNLMSCNLKAVLDARLHIVKKLITDYFMNHLKFQDLMMCLKNSYFLLDESFSQSLCEKLFPWVLNCQTVYQFANWTVLNEFFCNSFTEFNCTNFPFLSTGSVNVVDLPETDLLERNEFLYFFQFEFQINWPLNIIIHKGCISQYIQVFSFLLELEFLCWLLGRTWRSLTLGSNEEIQKSSQFRKIMLNRFDMLQFMCVLRNCIRHDLQGPIWDFLSKSLSIEKLSIDSLEQIHIQYLERILTRCFLTEDTKALHSLVKVICMQVYKFCTWALESTWEYNVETMQYEFLTFNDLCTVSDSYRNYQKTFYEFITKLTVTYRSDMGVDDGFKQYLEIILGSKRMFL